MPAVRVSGVPSLHVFTFKEGLLSAMAHDLRLHLARFEVELEDGRLRATFDPASLRVDGVVRGDRLDTAALDTRDHEKIERAIREDVLDTARQPTAKFEGVAEPRGTGFSVVGTLTLHGVARALSVDVADDGATLRTQVRFAPSAWGVRPYRALGGTLRVKDDVRVEVALPRADLDPVRGVAQSFRWRSES